MKREDLKIGDVRARGCYFTLYPAAKEAKINEDFMVTLLDAAEFKIPEYPVERADRPKWPLEYTAKDLTHSCRSCAVDELLAAGLITAKDGDKFALTQKALDVFLRASEIDEDLAAKNFHYCPCHCC